MDIIYFFASSDCCPGAISVVESNASAKSGALRAERSCALELVLVFESDVPCIAAFANSNDSNPAFGRSES